MHQINLLDCYFQELEAEDFNSGVVLLTQGKSHLHSTAEGYASRPWEGRSTLDMRFDIALIRG